MNLSLFRSLFLLASFVNACTAFSLEFVVGGNRRRGGRRNGSTGLNAGERISEVLEPTQFTGKLEELAGSNQLVVVNFSTTYCGPCKIMMPTWEALSDEYPNVVFLKCIGDKTPELKSLMKSQAVRAVPSFQFFKGGVKVDRVDGAKKEELAKKLKEHAT
uniref:Thioredoxin domain-containing protein n=1 Tax=Chromera velia CCMP2878 TaxID=1169474 RepID=A0A0G4I828_9ALVE|mmetsp:Transcript_31553/g.62411  ORF Transcript_31553/g.62411 Transcript_31553/m.62411 type:complete len:160 (-) Transcript_31553:225-704(-)|eukprot:Cvel_11761.t1-p1 / transcript=Cvel_11761.t1 / gene=Cvel_11761 / organism=Chromera_velia_CCMP2878 / gene_product=Thioredoxin H-type, putative / transcript_product=Thioredoxin H-type, putative / location=Cvel_scaffold747:49951-52282(+) / protein_length=159 / sequence_SO=supercontig / SO=protein_coding / is_pseudo=false